MRILPVVVVLLGAAVAVGLTLRGGDVEVLQMAAPAPTEAVAPALPAAPSDAPAVRIAAATTGRISGSVRDPANRPIAGVEVRVLITLGNGAEWRTPTTTDASGAFELIDVPRTTVAVHAAAPGFVAAQFDGLRVEDAPERHLLLAPFVLERAIVYRGVVRAGNRGVSGVSLRLKTAPDAPEGTAIAERSTTSDANGHFVFTEPPALPCTLTVSAPGCRRVEPRTIATPQDVAMVEVEPLERITGRVVDAATGEPLPHARVRIRQVDPPIFITNDRGDGDGRTKVGPDGSFDLQQPDAVLFEVDAIEADHLAAKIGPFDVGARSGPHFLLMSRGLAVQGSLTRHGQPIGGMARLRSDQLRPQVEHFVRVERDGALRLPAVPQGRYVLTVDPESGPRIERPVVVVAPGPVVVDVEVGDGGRIRGAVRGSDVAGGHIVCMHADGHERRATAEADGTYEAACLAPGEWSVVVLPKRDATGRRTKLWRFLDLAPVTVDTTADLHLDLVAVGDLFAAMTCPLGRSAQGSHVELVPRTPAQQRVPKDCLRCMIGTDGTYELDAIVPGQWLVRWTPRIGLVREVVVDLPAGRTTTVTFP